MKKYTPNQYVDIFDKLPMEIKDIIVSTSTTDHITLIGQKHNLHIDKIGELVDVTFDVMMGIVATKDFVKELQDTLRIGVLEASVLARDIDENIFKPIKEIMTHLYAGKAPYKPSSSLVQYYEEDEDHPALDKNALLKEIEDPVPSEVKKETIITPIKPTSTIQETQKPKEIDKAPETPHTEIAEYHEELRNTEKKPIDIQKSPIKQNITQIPIPPIKKTEIHIEEPLTTPQSKANSILDQLASIKLNKAFVMPKGPEGIRELSKMESEQLNSAQAQPAKESPTVPIFSISKPTIEPERQASTEPTIKSEAKIDPYRERI